MLYFAMTFGIFNTQLTHYVCHDKFDKCACTLGADIYFYIILII